jgi:dTDP-4-dehydrorhamnose 3,5-epimerase
MKATLLSIPGGILLEPKVFRNRPGFFFGSFNQAKFEAAISRHVTFVQDNHSCSVTNVLCGLHYQILQLQGKLIRVVQGEVFDVAVDIRQSSPTFGQWVGEILSAENKCQMWVPEGLRMASSCSQIPRCLYKTTDYYAPEHECCIARNDQFFAIQWPLASRACSICQRPERQIPYCGEAFPMTPIHWKTVRPLPGAHFRASRHRINRDTSASVDMPKELAIHAA